MRWGTAKIDCDGCLKNKSVHDSPLLLLFLKHLLLVIFLIFLIFSLMSDPNRTSKLSLGSREQREKKAIKRARVSSASHLAFNNLHAQLLFKAPHLLRNTALDFLVITNNCFYTTLIIPLNSEKSSIHC